MRLGHFCRDKLSGWSRKSGVGLRRCELQQNSWPLVWPVNKQSMQKTWSAFWDLLVQNRTWCTRILRHASVLLRTLYVWGMYDIWPLDIISYVATWRLEKSRCAIASRKKWWLISGIVFSLSFLLYFFLGLFFLITENHMSWRLNLEEGMIHGFFVLNFFSQFQSLKN
jgi:hypothetical protein